MTRHLLAFATAAAIGATAAPASAQDGPPPMHHGPGAPFAHPLPPGVYPLPYRPQGGPYRDGPGPYEDGPMIGHGEGGPAYGSGSDYWYAYQFGGAPCGCPSYTWVPVLIETHHRYSAPLRHVEEVVEEKVVREQVVESKIVQVPRATKYVKTAPAKVTKDKVVRRIK